jgi:hypothetical protein
VIKLLAWPPRLRVVLSVSVAATIPGSISCAVCATLSFSVSISLVVSVSLPTTFLVSTAVASTIVVVPACAASRVLEISFLVGVLLLWSVPMHVAVVAHVFD